MIEADLAAAQRTGSSPATSAGRPATLLSGIAVGSLFEEQKVFDVVVWGTPDTRSSLHSDQAAADRHAGGRSRAARRRRRRAHRPEPERDQSARASRGTSTSPLTSKAGGLLKLGDGLGREGRRRRSRQVDFPLEFHAEVLATGAAAARPLLRDRARGGDRDLPPAAGGVRQLAAGGGVVRSRCRRARRRAAGGADRRRNALVRLVRRPPRRARPDRAKRAWR